jgi:hypothetical protein
MSRRIWRFPFDDEIATLSKIEPDAVRAFIAGFPATDDWLITAAGGGIGLFSAYWIFTYRLPSVQAEFSADPIRAALTDLLGFFGGDALGISQAWIVAPAVIVSAAAAACAIDRHEPAKPVHLLLLMLSGPVFMALAGFSTPRSFLYLAPVLAGLMTMFCDQQLRGVYHGRLLVAFTLFLAACVSAIANINSGTHPFKRNLAIPYQAIFDFIRTNANGSFLVISSDPVVPWVLRAADGGCAGYYFEVTRCLDAGRRYDSIFVVSGHSDKSADATVSKQFSELIAQAIAGRSKAASLSAGRDEDAPLKTRLTGVPLEKTILTVDYYR